MPRLRMRPPGWARRSWSCRRSSPVSPRRRRPPWPSTSRTTSSPSGASTATQLSPALRDYLEGARAVTAEDAEAAAALGEQCRGALPGVLAGLDALLVPGVLGEAPLRSEGHTGDPLLCRAWTLLGAPAISVPGLVGPAGLPIGVQLVGLPAGEERLLGAAAWAEGVLSPPAGTS